MPRNSTELRSEITIPDDYVDALESIRRILEETRGTKHTSGEAIKVALSAVGNAIDPQIEALTRATSVASGGKIFSISRETRKEIDRRARAAKTGARRYISVVIVVFLKAALRSVARSVVRGDRELALKIAKAIEQTRTGYGAMTSAKPIKYGTRPARKLKDAGTMRHYKYTQLFTDYVSKFGGMDQWADKQVEADIYTLPIAGTPGKQSPEDLEQSKNPSARYVVKLWKRGRGYNITILMPTGRKRLTDGRHPQTLQAIFPPTLPLGSTYRLHDIWRNIDWSTITFWDPDEEDGTPY